VSLSKSGKTTPEKCNVDDLRAHLARCQTAQKRPVGPTTLTRRYARTDAQARALLCAASCCVATAVGFTSLHLS
jgi:hypothetical protein